MAHVFKSSYQSKLTFYYLKLSDVALDCIDSLSLTFPYFTKYMICVNMWQHNFNECIPLSVHTLVRPQVEYASAVWSPYTKENINNIEKSTKRQPDGSQMTAPHKVV